MKRQSTSTIREARRPGPSALALLLLLGLAGIPAGAEAVDAGGTAASRADAIGVNATSAEATSAEAAGIARLGVTLSTNAFVPLGAGPYSPVPAGLYGRAGVTWLPGNRLELELHHIPQVTPGFYSQVFFGLSAGWWLLERKHTGYFNMVVDAGCLYALDGTWLVALKLSPVVLGGPQYRTAERVLAVGLLFDPQRLRLLFQLQLIAITFYL